MSRRRRELVLLALGICAALATGCATRAMIHGIVVAPGPAGQTPGSTSGLDSAIVYVVPEKKVLTPSCGVTHAQLRETPGGFRPRMLMVTQHTEVEFLNEDRIYHNAFSVSPAKRFDVGPFGPGEERSVLFDRIGVVQVFCELHPESWAYVVVLPEKLYTRPARDGAFVLSDLPEGRCSVTVWHPTYGTKCQKVKVPKRGRIELKLAY